MPKSEFANKAEITKSDEVVLHPTGREGTPAADRGTLASQELEDQAVTTQPADHHIDNGTGEEETPDGLDAITEAVRQAAEDTPSGPEPEQDVPVFDQAGMPDKI